MKENQTAKIFTTGRSQAVRLPKAFRFDCDEVYISKGDGMVILKPKPKTWADYFNSGKDLSDDFPDDIEDFPLDQREMF